MALTGWSTSNYLKRVGQVVNTHPFMLSAWGWRDFTAVAYYHAMCVDQAALDRRRGGLVVNGNTFHAGCTIYNGATFNQGESTSVVPLSTWFHLSAAFVDTTRSEVRTAGGNIGVDTHGANDPAASDQVDIGRNFVGEVWGSTGALAELSCWTITGLTLANRDALDAKLAAGENPLTINAEASQPWTGQLVAYWPLTDTTTMLTDASGHGHTLTSFGTLTTFGTHPPVSPSGPPAEPTLVGVSAAMAVTATSGTNITPAFPAGYTAVADDIAVILAHHSANGPFNTPLAYAIASDGIETLDDNNTAAQRVTVFWHRLVAGDIAQPLVLTTNTSAAVRGAILFIIRNCRTTGTPFEVCKRLLNAAAATISFPSVTTTLENARLLALGAYEDDPSDRTTPTDWTEPVGSTFISALGNDMSLNYFTRVLAAAGTASAFTTTVSTGTFANSPSVGAVLAFVPPSEAAAAASLVIHAGVARRIGQLY